MIGRVAGVGIVAVAVSAGVLSAGAQGFAVSVPARPSAPVVTPGEGSGSVVVGWHRVADGGSPVTAFRVVAHPGGAGCVTGGSGLSCVVRGLSGRGPFTFQVIAVNAVGDSLPSAHSVGVDPNEKTVGVRTRLVGSLVAGRRVFARVRVPGGYDGSVTVRVAQRVLCRSRVVASAGECAGVLPGRVGRVPVVSGFVGGGDDAGVRGWSHATVVVGSSAVVTATRSCARTVVTGVGVPGRVVRVDALTGRGWVPMRLTKVNRAGRFVVAWPAVVPTVRTRTFSDGFLGVPVRVERMCVRGVAGA